MRRLLYLLAVGLLAAPTLAAEPPVIRVVDFEGVAVTGATATRIIRAIDDAEAAGDELVLIQLDTPGGLVPAMEEIVKRMLASEVPVVVWVGPAGAHAASAGFVILIAADVAAMAPGTRTGAASVIHGDKESTEDDVLLKKMNKDLAALLRSIGEHRGRNVEAAESAVFSADAYSEIEALELGLIELVARDRDDLLAQLDGMEITRFSGDSVVLRTAGARIVVTEHDFRQKLFEFLATPAVASILLLLGMAGLYVEMSHPGLVFPAVVGALCLILFFFAAHQLPISTIGVLLILLGIVMFVLEIKVASYGMLTLGGAVSLGIGLLMLVEGPIPELRVPPLVVLPSVLTFTAMAAFVVRLAVAAQRAPLATGVEGLAGEVGTVAQDLGPEGKVFVHGELWDAISTSGMMTVGTRARVVRADDMMLTVEAAEPRAGEE
jgi:membrane-bound serine protease (ClpP class)